MPAIRVPVDLTEIACSYVQYAYTPRDTSSPSPNVGPGRGGYAHARQKSVKLELRHYALHHTHVRKADFLQNMPLGCSVAKGDEKCTYATKCDNGRA